MLDDRTVLVLGGLYMAMKNGLDENGASAAQDTLWRFAHNPDLPAAARRAWGHIAHSASLSADDAERENAELDAMASPRPPLRVINGGAA